MDWAEQTNNMMNAWMKMQKDVWESWQETMQKATQVPPSGWERTIDTWETSFAKTLETQTAWISMWADGVAGAEGTPDETKAWATQIKDLVSHWNQFQADLWHGWFEMGKRLDPSQMSQAPGQWTAAAQNAMDTWQTHTNRAMELQAEWVNTWVSQQKED